LKLLLELGPLLVFFVLNWLVGMEWAVGVFMVLMVASVVLLRRREGRWPVMPLLGAVMVGALGGLTLYFGDETFIQLKPTVFGVFVGAVLLVGLARGRFLIRELFQGAFELTDAGWRSLTTRYAGFFLGLAGLNEVLRHVLTWDQWVLFKTFGIFALMFGFSMAQFGLIQRESLEEADGEA
jgi:intracellular septation protein